MSTSTNLQQHRDIVYCHQCENEWYRDEHGLTCPECRSDFTEIVEPQHDPRIEEHEAEQVFGDPEEDDIDMLGWERTRQQFPWETPGDNEREPHSQPEQESQGAGGGILSFLGSLMPGLLGAGQAQTPSQFESRPRNEDDEEEWRQDMPGERTHAPGTNIRHYHGPGYNVTIATSTSRGLHPRNANGPQMFESQPQNIEHMMHQMLFNIGARPAGPHQAGGGSGPFRGGPPGMPFGNIFQLLGVPLGMTDAHGDAVFTQEALDRVITQLMEQHQSGNAPGPATSETIAALPRRPIRQKDMDDNGKAECSICMDMVDLGTIITELPCHHWFHHDCIEAWLKEHDTCPHCRRGITQKDDPSPNQPRESSQTPTNDVHSRDFGSSNPFMPGGFPSSSSNQWDRNHQREDE